MFRPSASRASTSWSVRGAASLRPKGIPADRLAFLESNILATLKDPEFLAKAKKAGFIVQPLDSKATYKRWKDDDAALYPILLEAGLVKARQK